jgi:acyl dehydratase
MPSNDEANPEYGKITEDAIAKLRSRFGKTLPIENPYIRHVNQDSAMHVARAIGDTNPLYTNPEYAKNTRYGKLIAPPALFYALGWGSWDLRRGQGLPGVHGLHSGDTWWYYRPVFDGDKLYSNKTLIKAEPMEGRFAGKKMFIQADEIRFYNQNDELVAKQHMPVIRAEREAAKKGGKYTDIKKVTYSDEEIAQIDKEYKQEVPRGATPRYWEEVEVGEPVDPVVKGPLTLPDMVTWLQGIGSPHVRTGKYWTEYREQSPKVAVRDPKSGIPQAVERVHWDDWMAAEIGMPAAYDYGSQRGGQATYFATNWVGDDGWVSKLDFQFRGMVFHGDVFRISGEVTDKWRGAITGNAYVGIKFQSINNRGDDIMPGTGVFALPSTESGPVEFPVDVEEDGRTS